MEDLVTIIAARTYFGGVAAQTIYKMCATGKLKFVRLGRAYLFKRAWFEEAVQKAGGKPCQ